MSYRIEYSPSVDKYDIVGSKPEKKWILLSIGGIAFLLSMSFWPAGREMVRSFLIPGEDSITMRAFETMTNDLRSGADLYEAFCEFCRMVVHGV